MAWGELGGSGTYHSKPAVMGIPCNCARRWSPSRTTSRGFRRWWRWWWHSRPRWRFSSTGWAGTHPPSPIPGSPARTPRLPSSDPWPPPQANRRARVNPGVGLKTPSEQSLHVSSRVSEMGSSGQTIMIYMTCFLLPFTSHTGGFFFLTPPKLNRCLSKQSQGPMVIGLCSWHRSGHVHWEHSIVFEQTQIF